MVSPPVSMNFVVTGGAGFIGSHITEYLVKEQHSVTVIDDLRTGKIENLNNIKNEIEFKHMDILDYEKLKKIVKNIDGVFHEAALTAVQESFEKPKEYYDVNVKGTENIFKLAKEFGFKVVFASSSSVYGNSKKIPIREDYRREPINPYGQTKLEKEYLAEKFAKLGIEIIGLRYFNVYGPRQNNAYTGVITKFLENLVKHKPPIIYGDGLQVRDFVFVEDVARANLLAMKSKTPFAFINIGSGIATSIKDLAIMMIDASGFEIAPSYKDALKGDVKLSQADISLAKRELRWQPKTRLQKWLDDAEKFLN